MRDDAKNKRKGEIFPDLRPETRQSAGEEKAQTADWLEKPLPPRREPSAEEFRRVGPVSIVLRREFTIMRKFLATILTLGLIMPGALLAQDKNLKTARIDPPEPPAAAGSAQASAQAQTPQTVRPQPTAAQQRSYEREAHPRRRSGISKQEWLFLGAVAGTSMGIGALAGGAHGLAIGFIVGGWGAFAARKLWHKIR